MNLLQHVESIVSGNSTLHRIDTIPYAQFLGLCIVPPHPATSGAFCLKMPYSEKLIGSPNPPRLHGGTVGALLEVTGSIAVAHHAHREGLLAGEALPKNIGITVEFMRGGATEDTFAAAEVLRMGRRVANVRVVAWQSDPERLNATATMHFLMPDSSA